jgi:hypothetical protein
MKWISVVGLSVAVVALPAALSATSVTYSTSGVFSTTGTDMLPIGTGDLTFDGLVSNTVTPPSNLSFGTFDASDVGTGSIPDGEVFTLTVTETTPDSGSAPATATISGSIDATSSSVLLSFNNTSFSIDGTQYTISQPPGGFPIVPPSSNGGLVTIQGTVSAAPEPATYLGIGSGLALMAFGLRRRVRA